MSRMIWTGTTLTVLVASQVLFAPRFAKAALIASDDFESYAAGSDIVGQGAGIGWQGNYANDGGSNEIHRIEEGVIAGYGRSLSVGRSGGTGSFTRNSIVNRQFPAQDADELYIGFIVQPQLGASNTDDFLQLFVNASSSTASNPQNTSYSGGLETASFFARKGGQDQVYGTATFTSGAAYQIVLKISKSNPGPDNNYDSVATYVDGSLDVSLGPLDGDNINLTSMSNIHIRLAGIEVNDLFYVDNLRIATTFAEAVPEPGAILLASLGMIGLVGYRLRNRKQCC